MSILFIQNASHFDFEIIWSNRKNLANNTLETVARWFSIISHISLTLVLSKAHFRINLKIQITLIYQEFLWKMLPVQRSHLVVIIHNDMQIGCQFGLLSWHSLTWRWFFLFCNCFYTNDWFIRLLIYFSESIYILLSQLISSCTIY